MAPLPLRLGFALWNRFPDGRDCLGARLRRNCQGLEAVAMRGSLSRSNVSYCKDGLPKLTRSAYGIPDTFPASKMPLETHVCHSLAARKREARRNVSEAILPAVGVVAQNG